MNMVYQGIAFCEHGLSGDSLVWAWSIKGIAFVNKVYQGIAFCGHGLSRE